MKVLCRVILCFFLVSFLVCPVWAQEDQAGCFDHPMFTRMPGFYISSCRIVDYDREYFTNEEGGEIEIFGKVYRATYEVKEGVKPPSELQIVLNYVNAIKNIGGVVINQGDSSAYLKLDKDGKTSWIIVDAANEGNVYELKVVEKAEFPQVVVAKPRSIDEVLKTPEHVNAQKDAEGCFDHPMFTRMPNFYISSCDIKDFDRFNFVDSNGRDIKVEGKVYQGRYEIKEGARPPSELQIVLNYANAIKKIGGTVVKQNDSTAYLKLDKGGRTYWVLVDAFNGGTGYELNVVEKAGMEQLVVADAKSLMNDISVTGHASVYGIYFDFDKATIKPESEPAIAEVAKLLKQNTGLKLFVVGHTDNVGTLSYNMKLSEARARSVVRELTTKYGISAERLKGFGVGPLAPVASNKTDSGRARNRRVELVEQ